jgi:glucose/arabinose dehydrogenase
LERALAVREKWNNALNSSDIFARVVALIGGTALRMRRLTEGSHEPAWGSSPAIPAARPQGSIPTLKMPTAKGWTEGQTPVAAPGLTVNAFAAGLDHPRRLDHSI